MNREALTQILSELEQLSGRMDNETLTDIITDRLKSYPGAHANESWKKDRNLNHCTRREREEMERLGVTPEQLTDFGLNRGEVHHILFGYRYTIERRR